MRLSSHRVFSMRRADGVSKAYAWMWAADGPTEDGRDSMELCMRTEAHGKMRYEMAEEWLESWTWVVKEVTHLTSVLTCGAANAELPLQANLFPRGR